MSKVLIWKKRLYEILEKGDETDKASKKVDFFLLVLISLNVLAVIIETEKSLAEQFQSWFNIFEYFSVVFFSIEYVLRLWTCTENTKYTSPVLGRLLFIFSIMALIDLLAILPSILPIFLMTDLRFIRAVRLFRLFRILKFGRYTDSLKLLINVLKSKKEEFMILVLISILILIFSSSILHLIEGGENSKGFSSIPAAMWWGVAALTTVGYGDVYPVTPLGKFFSSLIALLGIGMVALPTGILASGFVEELNKKKHKKLKCPNCGAHINNSTEVQRGNESK